MTSSKLMTPLQMHAFLKRYATPLAFSFLVNKTTLILKDFFSPAQIVHQTTEAVSENRYRVQHLNESMVVLRLNAQVGADNLTSTAPPTEESPYYPRNPDGVVPAGLRAPQENVLDDDYYYEDSDASAQGT